MDTPWTWLGLKNKSWLLSIRTFTVNLSTTGGWIGAALAISMPLKPPAAAAPANATEAFRNSRLLIASVMFISLFCEPVHLTLWK
jgi:hypothetical protein